MLLPLLACGATSVPSAAAHAVKFQLQRQSKATPAGVDKIFYVAHTVIGDAERGEKQQTFNMIFDLGSGQVFLPSMHCGSQSCKEHNTYDKWASKTAVDINGNGHAVLEAATTPQPRLRKSEKAPMHGQKVARDLANVGVDFLDIGAGQYKGELVKDRLCLTPDASWCVELGLVVVTEMSDLPFRSMPNDGVVGLGLEALSVGREFSFLAQAGDKLEREHAGALQFGLFLGSAGGDIVFGGYDPKHIAPQFPLMWTPVANPEEGLWQLSIIAVRVGNKTLSICGAAAGSGEAAPLKKSCGGLIDTSSSKFRVSESLGLGLEDALRDYGGEPEAAESVGAGGEVISASRYRGYGDGLVHMELVLEGGAVLTLRPEDYASSPDCVEEPAACRPLIERHNTPDPDLFILGESVLRRYYSVFDWGEKRIGFGLAAADGSAMPQVGQASRVQPGEPASDVAADTSTTPIPHPKTTAKSERKGFLATAPPSAALLV